MPFQAKISWGGGGVYRLHEQLSVKIIKTLEHFFIHLDYFFS
jgi:hypothetical protein